MPVGAGIAGAGGALAGGLIQYNSAQGAKKAAQGAANKNNALADKVYGINTGNLQPFVNQGQGANTALAGLLGIGGDPNASRKAFGDYLGSTNYNFLLDQGLKGTATANAASFNSSATAKALNNYAQGAAGQALGGYESALSGLAGTGLSAAGTLGGLGSQYVSQESSNNNNAAGITASADLAQGNAGANALSGIVRGISGAASSFGAPTTALSGFGLGSTPGPAPGSGYAQPGYTGGNMGGLY